MIAIVENDELLGYNVSLGGGLGKTFGMDETYARLGDVIGYVSKDKVLQVVEEIVKVQRDYGNRENRKLSRLT